jgi:hypothetical protein
MKLPVINKKTLNAKFVICWWIDTVSDSEWSSLQIAKSGTPTVCISAGWLIKKNKKVHIICADVNFLDDEKVADVGNVTTIPTVNIIKTKVIKI